MPRLGRELGLSSLAMKRDDLQPLGLGGNKLRKLEYLLADPAAEGADTLVTVGALQSNHARLTAAVAARLGLACDLLLVDRVPRSESAYRYGANRILNELFGARTRLLASTDDVAGEIELHCDRLRRQGRKPFAIPFGGSTWRGALGYVEMVGELLEQIPESMPRPIIVCACGSAGMMAGILAGVAAFQLEWEVIGLSVLARSAEIEPVVERLATEVLGELEMPGAALPDWRVLDSWIGEGYGVPTDSMRCAVRRVASTEGVVLDPVYTGKAMAGLLALVEEGREIDPERPVIFVHSGGSPGIFAYPDVFGTEEDEKAFAR